VWFHGCPLCCTSAGNTGRTTASCGRPSVQPTDRLAFHYRRATSGDNDRRSRSYRTPGKPRQCLPRVAPLRLRQSLGVETVDLLFSKGFFQQISQHAQAHKYPLQLTALIFHGLQLGAQGRIHLAIFRPPFVKRSVPSHGVKTHHCRAMASCHVRSKAGPSAYRLQPDASSR
jgi:hypothetical protein